MEKLFFFGCHPKLNMDPFKGLHETADELSESHSNVSKVLYFLKINLNDKFKL